MRYLITRVATAVIASLALAGLFGASSALAAPGFDAEEYSASVSSHIPEYHFLKFNAVSVACEPPILNATTMAGATESLDASSEKAGSCTSIYGGSMNANGCHIMFHPGAGGTGAGTVEIGPSGCGPITLGSSYCQITIGPQTLNANYENSVYEGVKSVTVSVSVTNLAYTQVSGYGCTHASYTNGQWTGSWELTGSHSGTATALRVAPRIVPNQIHIDGESLNLVADAFPATVVAEQGPPETSGQLLYEFSAGKLICNSVQMEDSISGATRELALAATYSGCTGMGIFVAEVKMNGCTYDTYIDAAWPSEQFPTYMSVSCPSGKAIEVIVNPPPLKTRCTITIGFQQFSERVTFSNRPFGEIEAPLAVTGLSYHQQKGEGIGACTTGDYTNGKINGTLSFYGKS